MKEEELKLVYEAIDKHGDSFWNDPSSNPDDNNAMGSDSWNGYLFDEIISMLRMDGFDLKVVKNRTKPLKRRAWKYLTGWGWIQTRIPEVQRRMYERLKRDERDKEAKELLSRYMQD